MTDSSHSKCIDEITNFLHKINNPVHLSNVHDWVIKLTTGEPNSWKTDYLRLLEYTLKSEDGIQEPFMSSPPDNLFSDCNVSARSSRSLAADAAMVTSSYYERISSLTAGGGSTSDEGFTDVSENYVKECISSICGQKPNRPEATTKSETVARTVSDNWSEIEPHPELVNLLKRMEYESVSLQQFMGDVKRYTCDSGQLMFSVADELLGDFQKTAEVAYDDRTQKLGDALAKEQVTLLIRYRKNGNRMLSRAQILQDHLRELMPSFQYEKYLVDPEQHIRTNILKKNAVVKKTVSDLLDVMKNNDDGDVGNDPSSGEDRMDATMMHQKKMTCALNWLRSEVVRADCENTMLRKRYDIVVAAIAKASKRKVSNECQAKTEQREARNQLNELRNESAKQIELIDLYVERISMERASHKDNSICQ